ncbi:uncharacterized protein F4822DRAFT_373753 [Hypoxylon trugodes]|uniref:uncharacterized protein n=1 Tax=Hypoxylon trugodes TaxID=326681 RepID=UPI00218D5A04|nr:uncharacterized protein F4822DRAFT_373753 [Hypoxylon trugodes]KAI1384804.1 hypothetical protein F4822DRAFT_373753 [Hypoxylon trugodes]
MGDVLGPRTTHTRDGRILEDSLASAIFDTVRWAVDIQESLEDVRGNTRKLFWWSSIFVVVCIGLFIVASLVRLGSSIDKMIQYQELFRRMWDEDKERARRREQRAERYAIFGAGQGDDYDDDDEEGVGTS